MWNRHVSRSLSAYCHGELEERDAARITAHLRGCERCRKEYEEIRLGVHLAGQVAPVSAPGSLWTGIEQALDRRQQATPTAAWALNWRRIAAGTAAVALVGACFVLWRWQRQPVASWKFERRAAVGSSAATAGLLRVGEVLETDKNSRARLEVGAIGEVQVEPNTRLRLVKAQAAENRLALDRGAIEAKISGPRRLFFVDTPSAEAVDLGCAYRLEVDELGRSYLHVTDGLVSLVHNGRQSYVPVGATCEARPELGLGTPYLDDAAASFRDALKRFDFEGGGDDEINVILTGARTIDAFSLWHLLWKVDETQRGRILDVLGRLVPMPEGVTREGALQLDKKMLYAWKVEIDSAWF